MKNLNLNIGKLRLQNRNFPYHNPLCFMLKKKKMRIILITILLFTLTKMSAMTLCEKCDIEKINIIYNNLDNLTFEMVDDFLCTFDKSCKNNVEFTQWSNEMLFKVLTKSPELYFKVLTKGKLKNAELLLEEIKNPVIEIDYQIIYDKIKKVDTEEKLKKEYLKMLRIEAEKEGIMITD